VFASWFYVLFKFRFAREPPKRGPLQKSLKIMSFFIYDANYFIKFLSKNYFINGLKNCDLYILYRYYIVVLLQYLNTSYNMNFLALNDDVKFIIANHLQSDRKINKIFMNEPDDNLQQNLFGEVKELTLDIEEVCIDLVNDNKNLKMKLNFLKKIIIKYTWINIFMNHIKN
jgi:hypothetical protein